MSSKSFTLRLPENLQAMLLRHVCEPETSNFIRAAIAEKLIRDFGEKIRGEMMPVRARKYMTDARNREKEFSSLRRAAIGFFKSIPGAIDADPTIAGAVVELNFSDDKSFFCRLSRKELSSPYLMKETRDRVVRVLQVMRRCDKDILDFKFAFE